MARLLLVDDNPGTLVAYTEVFAALEPTIHVTTALTAESALRLMHTVPFDAVVCDLVLPGVDGLGFVDECVTIQPGMPVILVTGYGDTDLQKTAAHRGAYALLHKPVDPYDLRSVVLRAILQKRVTLALATEEAYRELIVTMKERLQRVAGEDRIFENGGRGYEGEENSRSTH